MKFIFSLLISLLVLSTALGHDISGESHSGEFVAETYEELRVAYLTLVEIKEHVGTQGDRHGGDKVWSENIWKESTSYSYYSTEEEAKTASEEYSIGGGIVNVGDKSITGITISNHVHYRSSIPASDDPHSHIHLEKGTENPVSAEKHSHPYTDAHHTHGEEHDTITHPGDLVPLTVAELEKRGVVVNEDGTPNHVTRNGVQPTTIDTNKVTEPVLVPVIVDNDGVARAVDVKSGAAASPVVTPVIPGEISPENPTVTFIIAPFVTEHMIADWSRFDSRLPTWIELYNPNNSSVSLEGYTFEYAFWHQRRQEYINKTLTLGSLLIPAQSAVILTNKIAITRGIGGIDPETQVYNLSIPDRVLKVGWVIMDAQGRSIDRRGIHFGDTSDPIKGRHVDNLRASHKVVSSADPETSYYYGSTRDIGSPGFHLSVRAAPSMLRKQVGLWGSLKQE